MGCKQRGIRTLVCVAAIVAASAAWAQTVNDFPKREDPLSVRADLFDKLVRGNHWNEGVILPMVIFPPAGNTLPTVGRHENAALHTGLYLAALSLQYAVTKSPEIRVLADQVMDGILKLETVTGQEGCVARSFYKADGVKWHEQAFFLPSAWHDSSSMEGYRWLGMLGADQFTTLVAGVGTYFELCADDVHRKTAAAFVDRAMGRCVEDNMCIAETNGKTSLYGSFCPDLPHEPLKSLLLLSNLKTALKLTGKVAYQAACTRLIVHYHYDDEAILARDSAAKDTSGDLPAALALQTLMRNEDNPILLQKDRESLNRYWCAWKQGGDPLFAMAYQALSGEKVIDDAAINAIKALWGGDRQHGSWNTSSPDGPKTTEADYDDSPVRFLYTYWLGRQTGVIAAEW